MRTASSKNKVSPDATATNEARCGVLNFALNTEDKIFYEVKPQKVPVSMNNEIHYGLFATSETIPAMSVIAVFQPLSTWKIAAVNLPLRKTVATSPISSAVSPTVELKDKVGKVGEFEKTKTKTEAEAEAVEAIEDQWAAALYPQLLKITTKRKLLESSDLTPKMDNLIPRRDFLRPQMTNSKVTKVKSVTKMTESAGYAAGLEVLKLKLRHNSFVRLPAVTKETKIIGSKIGVVDPAKTTETKSTESAKTIESIKYIERALFAFPSFLNHSCAHNCVFFPKTGVLFSLCEIQVGEELTISYINNENSENVVDAVSEDNIRYVSNSACPLPSPDTCSCAVCKPRPRLSKSSGADDDKKMLAKLVASVSSCHNCRTMPEDGKTAKVAAENFEQCPKCHIALYCSAACRKDNWRSSHKLVCEELRQT